MVKKFIRGIITFFGFWLGVGFFFLFVFIAEQTSIIDFDTVSKSWTNAFTIISGLIFALILFLLTPAIRRLSSKIAKNMDAELRHMSAQDLFSGVAGLVIGLIISYLITPVTSIIANSYISVTVTIVVYIIFAWLGIVIGTRKGRDVIAAVTNARKNTGQIRTSIKSVTATPKILDTSVIIDGRVLDILETGFIEGKVIIPDFVLVELRHIADSSDGLKRNRGRRGLDILNKIQEDFGVEIYSTTSEKGLSEIPEVDVKLLKLAQNIKGKVVTNDFNLNKVAQIQGVEVLNINELTNNLKPVVLPGEEMTLFLVKEGKEHGQAVAYMDDGTMIVIEDGKEQIGNTVPVYVTSVLQTSAGRMIFARLK